MFQFLLKIISFFNANQIPYMLSGSVAMSIYILPRATRDIDIVANIMPLHVPALVNAFKDEYYCDKESITKAIKQKSIFNIIDHQSGFKADFVILKDTPFRQAEFERRVETIFQGEKIYIVTAEDLFISKLIWVQDYQGLQQIEDLKALSAYPEIDWVYVKKWIKELKLSTFDIQLKS